MTNDECTHTCEHLYESECDGQPRPCRTNAEPTLTDTGTLFPTTKYCTNCHQKIERVGPGPARTELAALAWIHSHNRSMYCYGRGD
jgi:hypothetical protein